MFFSRKIWTLLVCHLPWGGLVRQEPPTTEQKSWKARHGECLQVSICRDC